jgi:type IV pilus assembly protein PilB
LDDRLFKVSLSSKGCMKEKVQTPSQQKKRLGDILCEAGLISPDQLKKALEEHRLSTGKRLGEILIQLKIATESAIARTLSSQLGFQYVDLLTVPVEPEAIARIPESLAKKHQAIPVSIEDSLLRVAFADPLDYESIRDLGFSSGCTIRPVIATRKDILEAIERHYNLDSSVEGIVKDSAREFEDALIQIIPELSVSENDARPLDEKSRTAPVIRLANLILAKAIKLRASDIHLEPSQREFGVRYRIDGILKEDVRLPKWVQGALVSRIKILAKLDIAERRMPQDGGVRVKSDDREIDLRISMVPTQYGEKVVIRILDQGRVVISLDSLGLSPGDLQQIQSFIRRRKGIILLTGPTGSGKTTTLYSMINAIKSKETNIVTVEDPIEYNLEGINQIQVNSEIGLTFAHCLRAILRQDPNVILIGEIRDLETAEIAFRAAMTGHLVLSTLHTNDAAGSITRLIDIGIPRYLVASLLIGVMAQRLVRTVCPRCAEPRTPSVESMVGFQLTPEMMAKAKFYYGKGCNHCNFIGFHGRTALFEILDPTPRMREMIVAGASEQDLRSVVVASDMSSLGKDGLNKVKSGLTTIEELMRVIELREGLQSLCASCGHYLHMDFIVCPHCGTPASHHCTGCGKKLQPEWKVCPYCCQAVRAI